MSTVSNDSYVYKRDTDSLNSAATLGHFGDKQTASSSKFWINYVRFTTFWIPDMFPRWLLSTQDSRRILAWREKMTWVIGLLEVYGLVLGLFLIYPESGCRSASTERVLQTGLESSFNVLTFNSALCEVLTMANFCWIFFLMAVIGLAIFSGVHSTMKPSYVYKKDPASLDSPLVMHIPCYSEPLLELRKTINSCAQSDFTDSKKLLFVVSDGLVTGHGNDKSTPDYLTQDIFLCEDQNPIPVKYTSVELGDKRLNEAVVYCGIYETEGHSVPYVLVIKVGTENEQINSQKPGNRGKRDSQLIIYKFFHQAIFGGDGAFDWEPLQRDIIDKMGDMIQKDAGMYEYLLVADADTFIYPEGIRQLVSFLECSPKHFGVCGETKIGNRTASFCAFTQAFEYFITHAILKAMENVCSEVLVLSGCYTIYRFRNYNEDGSVSPCILHPRILEEYCGEDRYLTVLAMLNLPNMHNKYLPKAKCHTNAPVDLTTLLSQRRRWTNSLIHCHVHLANRIRAIPFYRWPGLLFIMALELYYIFLLPLMIPYSLVTLGTGYSSFNTIFVAIFTIGVPLVLALVTMRPKQWIYCLAFILYTPIYSVIIPLYSVWRMDDFGWGATRKTLGEEKGSTTVHG